MKKQEYKEQERHYYFFDYLFWLGENNMGALSQGQFQTTPWE